MLEAGQIVEGRVYRAEPYGVFLRHGESELFVHLPELSWTDHRPANERDLLNRRLRVLIVARHPDKDQWTASVRRAEPEKNPFLEIDRLPAGTVLRGEVVYKTADSFFVRLENDAEGIIPRSTVARELRIGEVVDVTVLHVDAEEGRLQLRLQQERH